MNPYTKIRAALEQARQLIPEYCGIRTQYDDAFAALAELERAAAEPVAWMWNDMLGISHTYVSPKRPTWPDAGASPEMAEAINVRPLYAAPPAPVAEIREPTPEECERISMAYYDDEALVDRDHRHLGRDIFRAVRAVMFPQKSEVL